MPETELGRGDHSDGLRTPDPLGKLMDSAKGATKVFLWAASLGLLFLPVIEFGRNLQQEASSEEQKAIDVTFEQGKNWDSAFSNINRERLGRIVSLFHQWASEPGGMAKIKTLCEELSDEDNLCNPEKPKDRSILNALNLTHGKLSGYTDKSAPILDPDSDNLSSYRAVLLDSLNTYEEIAMLRLTDRSEQVQTIIDKKFWPNIVKRTDDLRIFIDIYNRKTYWDRGMKEYRAWNVLSDQVKEMHPSQRPNDLPKAYVDECANLEATYWPSKPQPWIPTAWETLSQRLKRVTHNLLFLLGCYLLLIAFAMWVYGKFAPSREAPTPEAVTDKLSGE